MLRSAHWRVVIYYPEGSHPRSGSKGRPFRSSPLSDYSSRIRVCLNFKPSDFRVLEWLGESIGLALIQMRLQEAWCSTNSKRWLSTLGTSLHSTLRSEIKQVRIPIILVQWLSIWKIASWTSPTASLGSAFCRRSATFLPETALLIWCILIGRNRRRSIIGFAILLQSNCTLT